MEMKSRINGGAEGVTGHVSNTLGSSKRTRGVWRGGGDREEGER